MTVKRAIKMDWCSSSICCDDFHTKHNLSSLSNQHASCTTWTMMPCLQRLLAEGHTFTLLRFVIHRRGHAGTFMATLPAAAVFKIFTSLPHHNITARGKHFNFFH